MTVSVVDVTMSADISVLADLSQIYEWDTFEFCGGDESRIEIAAVLTIGHGTQHASASFIDSTLKPAIESVGGTLLNAIPRH